MSLIRYYRNNNVMDKEVEAIQLTHDNIKDVVAWCGGQPVEEIDPLDAGIRYVGLNVRTFAGLKRVSEGDYIVKDATGMVEKYKPGAFRDMFQLA